ncbi:MAG: nitroreductase family protein [Christensenellaceae bacterium]
MDLKTAMQERHSVRSYLDRPIESEICEELNCVIDECNSEGGLHIQLVTNEPKAFDGFMAHYGKFSGVKNYVALIGKKGKDEQIGYYGEKIVLTAQSMGLNTCWVAMTYKKIKTAFTIEKGEKLYCVLALGYGVTQGVAHKVKSYAQVSDAKNPPEWFMDGVNAALLAPTAMNQQKFIFSYENGKVSAKAGVGFYSKIDLGIAKYHFELGSGYFVGFSNN